MSNNPPQNELSKNTIPNMIPQLSSVPKASSRQKLQVPIWGREGPSAGTGTDDHPSAGTGTVTKWDPTYILRYLGPWSPLGCSIFKIINE